MFQKIAGFILLVIGLISCKKNDTDNTQITPPSLNLTAATQPFMLTTGAVFYCNVRYNAYPENVFDIFMPASAKPTCLIVQIHGGGFKSGDKADNYYSAGFQTVTSAIALHLLHSIIVYCSIQMNRKVY